MKKIIKIVVLFVALIICNRTFGQTGKIITGTVSDDKGPIPAATIFEKEFTNNGISTDENGHFSIKLRGTQGIIVVKSIGYLSQEINVSAKSKINVILKDDAKGLEEVVVLGVGQTTKKVTVTGAVSTISGEKIRQSPSASLQNSLAGRLPGFFSQQRSGQPGNDGAAFQIRGISTYAGGTTPLIIVDDVEVSADQISLIDQNEVENVTILKDASTTAVYGIRGANGVVIITTRRGQSGKPSLNFKNESGLQMPTQRPVVNSGYVTLNLLRERLAGLYTNPLTSYSNFFSGDNLNHYLTNDDPYNHPNVNWWDEVIKKVSLQNRINFDVSGGTGKVKYFVNLGYLYQGGLFKDFSEGQGYNSNYLYNRYNFRSNIDITPNKNLKIKVDLSGRFGVTNEPNDKPWNNGGTTFQYLWDGQLSSFLYPIYWPNGLIASSASTQTKPNPVANLMYSGYNRTYNNNIAAATSANQLLDVITPGLSANFLVSYTGDYSFTRNLTRSSSEILAYSYDPATQKYNPTTANLYRMGVLTRSTSFNLTKRTTTIRGGLNYSRNFGDHSVSALALLNQTRTNILPVNSTTVTLIDPYNIQGFTGKATYAYKQKYMVDLTAAYNGSDRFSENNRFAWFPAASVGWNVSEEKFIKDNLKFINFLKIRASYGLTGNDNIGVSSLVYQKNYSTGSSGIIFGETPQSYSGIVEPTLANTNVKWMTVKDFDIGLDAKLFNSKLSLTFDYFNKLTSDIFTTPGLIPSTFGASLPPYNLGRVRNTGYEIDLTYRDKIGKNLEFFVNGNLTYAKNIVLYRNEPGYLYDGLASTGKPVGAVFQYTFDGYYESLADLYTAPRFASSIPLSTLQLGSLKYKDLTGDGIIDANDRQYIGNNNPNYTGGLSFGFSYKGFDVSTLFQGNFDYIINMNRGALAYARPDRVSVPWNANRWTPENAASATFPELSSNTNNGVDGANPNYSTFWFVQGDFVRWKNFEVGYRFPAAFAKKLHVNNIRVYANGYNMGIVYTKVPTFIDPESALTSTVGEYPQQRVLNFGVQFGL
ncbi:TonB-dependent receptor [Pedobacter riviphilus]|uniref:TonB-dependent receptor n=1 Tax=Pedobacter riviphilus TaxID=2766984 RepID=A0ABX6TNB5_9SPHI|nr:TonB-dependent receptor [Pedobacter riviphilus]QNR86706.1 TonB-dependent receptor [Pedobacter riviphilus]